MKQPKELQGKKDERNTAKEQVILYETISPLLDSAFDEVKEFSKKKQDASLNVKKVKIINRLLEKAKELLKKETTIDFLELLDENELPSNSDAVLVMSQYISALRKFHSDHYHSGDWDFGFRGEWD